MHDPEYIPDHNKTDMNIKLRCSFQALPHQYKSLLWPTKSQRYIREKQKTNKKTLQSQSEYPLTSEMFLELELHLVSELPIPSKARRFLDYQSKFGT